MTAATEIREAGRALDAEIATWVMGWVCERRAPYPPMSERAKLMCWHRPDNPVPRNLPRFSTDIAAAFLVVEKMRAESWHVRVFGTHTAAVLPGWRCEIQFVEPSPIYLSETRFYRDYADTAPLAICLAALQAVAVSPSLVVQETDT